MGQESKIEYMSARSGLIEKEWEREWTPFYGRRFLGRLKQKIGLSVICSGELGDRERREKGRVPAKSR